MGLLLKQGVPFTQVPNTLLNDKTMSLKAKGLYSFMMSKPDRWDFSGKRLANQLKEGYDSVIATVRELKDNGWLRYEKLASGKVNYTLVFDKTVTVHDTEEVEEEKPSRSPVNTKADGALIMWYKCFRNIVLKHNELFPDNTASVPKAVDSSIREIPKSALSRLRWAHKEYDRGEVNKTLIALKKTVEFGGYDDETAKYLNISTIFKNTKNFGNVVDFQLTKPKKKAKSKSDKTEHKNDYNEDFIKALADGVE